MQLKLALENLKCCNPRCNRHAAYGDWFCSMECANELRIANLSKPMPRRDLVAIGVALLMAIFAAACA